MLYEARFMTNKKILQTTPIVLLYGIIQILKLGINLYFLNNWYDKGVKVVQNFFR